MNAVHYPELLPAVKALEETFDWSEIPEGERYWLDVFDRLVAKLCPGCKAKLEKHHVAMARRAAQATLATPVSPRSEPMPAAAA